jgi:hypothetical protein
LLQPSKLTCLVSSLPSPVYCCLLPRCAAVLPLLSRVQGCASDRLIDTAVMGGPKVFVVATLASSRPAAPFAFRNYELPDEATPIAEQLAACSGSCKHHVWEVRSSARRVSTRACAGCGSCSPCEQQAHHTDCKFVAFSAWAHAQAPSHSEKKLPSVTLTLRAVCVVLQAVRASSAAPYYLDDFLTADGKRFQDGATTANNPTVIALQQARLLHPQVCGRGLVASRQAGWQAGIASWHRSLVCSAECDACRTCGSFAAVWQRRASCRGTAQDRAGRERGAASTLVPCCVLTCACLCVWVCALHAAPCGLCGVAGLWQ